MERLNTSLLLHGRNRGARKSEGQRIPEPFREFLGDEFFEWFHGPMVPQKRQSLGSGVVVNLKGYILTNHHVVAPVEVRGTRQLVDQTKVGLSNGNLYPAEVVEVDPESDLAVLKIDAKETLMRVETVEPILESLSEQSALRANWPECAVDRPRFERR